MSLSNSQNSAKGKNFQKLAANVLTQHFGVEFLTEKKFLIGHPPKLHKFDLASSDLNFIGESKKYSWTETGNVPSAKMGFINEAIFYLHHLPRDKQRFIVMCKAVHPRRQESLAEYYFRTYTHLLNGVFIIEVDEQTQCVREFKFSNF
jgi:hypothetical protein